MDDKTSNLLIKSLESFRQWKDSFGIYESHPSLQVDAHQQKALFDELVHRLGGNYPFHHPVYAGQMLKPPHQIAWAAYALAMSINPNNHALDGGPPSSEMEKEVLADLAQFFGYENSFLGHLTASGTIANLEALWVARQTHPGKKIAFSGSAHYTHERMCGVLGVNTQIIDVDSNGNFNLESLKSAEIGTVVVTLGTTGLGEVEPLDQVLAWTQQHGIRLHIDAAYGGFFRTLKDSALIDGAQWQLMNHADSLVVDPHKHGLQPYGCGAVLFKNPDVGRYYKHDSPYTYFTSNELHLGEISLECSRAGAAAVALWATLQCFPLKEKEGFGPILAACRKAAINGFELMENSEKLVPYQVPELDILAYFPIHKTTAAFSEISNLSRQVFQKGMDNQSFFLSLYKIPAADFIRIHPQFKADEDHVTILRSVFMRPEQEQFVHELIRRIEAAI